MSYTKGEWKVEPIIPEKRGIIIRGEDGGIIARVATVGGVLPEAIANAHLMASSPDMYEALKAALPALQGIFDDNDNRPQHIKDRINIAVKALAKAEGR